MPRTLTATMFAFALVTAHVASARAEAPIRVAVMPFESASGDAEIASLGKGLQAMITTDLLEVGAYELVERSRLVDIQSELALSKSGAVDKATAVKIGKLAGASYLLTGTVTVLGEVMRIDARIFATQTGEILLAEKIEGPKAEFFDLEKALVKKLVGVTGVTLSPKVRVKVDRVHTADFKAFKTYGEAIQAFDQKDYQGAIEGLKRAAAADPDFTLATLTLAQYEEQITGMRARAIEVDLDKRKEAEIAQSASAQKELATLKPLWELAKKQGKAQQIDRLWGIFNLYHHYDDSYSTLAGLYHLEDRFELERIADVLAAQYFAESQALVPRVPLTPDFVHNVYWQREPADAGERARNAEAGRAPRKNWDRLCVRLHLDDKGCADLLLKAVAKLEALGVDRSELASLATNAAKFYRKAGEIDASTIAFAAAQKLTTDAYTAKTLVKEVEANRDVKRFLTTCNSPWAREYLVGHGWGAGWSAACDDSTYRELAEPLSLEGRQALGGVRGIPIKQAILVDGHPVWTFDTIDVRTGPRQSESSTSALVYYREKARDYGVLSVVDGVKARDLTLSLELGFAPLASWYPHDGHRPRAGETAPEYTHGRPRVALLFGLADVDVIEREDPATQTRRVVRPMRGYGVVLGGESVELVAVEEDPGPRTSFRTNRFTDLSRAGKRLTLKSLGSQRLDRGARARDVVSVRLTLKGKAVRLTIAGETVAFELPKPAAGYYGVWFEGEGYVHMSKLTSDQ